MLGLDTERRRENGVISSYGTPVCFPAACPQALETRPFGPGLGQLKGCRGSQGPTCTASPGARPHTALGCAARVITACLCLESKQRRLYGERRRRPTFSLAGPGLIVLPRRWRVNERPCSKAVDKPVGVGGSPNGLGAEEHRNKTPVSRTFPHQNLSWQVPLRREDGWSSFPESAIDQSNRGGEGNFFMTGGCV